MYVPVYFVPLLNPLGGGHDNTPPKTFVRFVAPPSAHPDLLLRPRLALRRRGNPVAPGEAGPLRPVSKRPQLRQHLLHLRHVGVDGCSLRHGQEAQPFFLVARENRRRFLAQARARAQVRRRGGGEVGGGERSTHVCGQSVFGVFTENRKNAEGGGAVGLERDIVGRWGPIGMSCQETA